MSVFRVQDKTPEVYTSTSRDFQLIGRLYDCIINGVKFDADSILDNINTDNIDSRLLKLLQTKIGFFSSKDITDESLRYILKAFPEIIKHKGSIKSIRQAVCTFLKLNGIKSTIYINKTNNSLSNPYTIEIGIDDTITNTYILDEILKYILPTGYTIMYTYHKDFDNMNLVLESKIGASIIIVKDSVSSLLRGNYISYTNDIENRLLGSIGETQISTPYDTTYKGALSDVSKLPQYTDDKSSHVGEIYSICNNSNYENISIVLYVYEYDYTLNDYTWNILNSGKSYNIFNSSKYGYYKESDGNFYENKESLYLADTAYFHSGLKISNSSDPESASISHDNSNVYLIDKNYNLMWFSENGIRPTWESKDVNTFGEKFVGNNPNEDYVKIVPKRDSVVLREKNEEYRIEEVVWTTKLGKDNEYAWVRYNGDISELEISTRINGDPESAKILWNKDGFIYSDNSNWCLNSSNNDWEIATVVQIDGNPNFPVYIVPNIDVHVFNDTDSWTADTLYTNLIQPDSNVLYIDADTYNGYKFNSTTNSFEEVMHFMRADNIYEINMDELEYLIENGFIEPAFRDNSTIFTDRYGNLFLL